MLYAGFGHMVPRGLRRRTLRLLAVNFIQLSYEILLSHPPNNVKQFYCDASVGSLHMLVTKDHGRARETTGVQGRARESTADQGENSGDHGVPQRPSLHLIDAMSTQQS